MYDVFLPAYIEEEEDDEAETPIDAMVFSVFSVSAEERLDSTIDVEFPVELSSDWVK